MAIIRTLLLSLCVLLFSLPAQGQGFFGTTTLLPFEISVNNERVLRLEPGPAFDGPNVIIGSSGNGVAPGVDGATISGGGTPVFPNRVEGDYGTIGGGVSNTASAFNATVGGGSTNTASGSRSTVGGGLNNTASNLNSTVGGGYSNTASGSSSTVGGGSFNTVAGVSSTVPGGNFNAARGDYSFAAGYYARAVHDGTFVWSDNSQTFADSLVSTAEDQFLIRASGGVGIGTNTPESTVEINMPLGTTEDDYGLLLNADDRRWNLIVGGAHAANAAFLQLLYKNHDQTTYTPRVTFTHTGRLGVSNTNPVHPLVVGTDVTDGNGAHVTAGGTWNNGSSRSFKENFAQIDVEAVLKQVATLPITQWRYKGGQGGEHIGPVAEDFFKVFGLGEDARYIATIDADGVALAAIQGLYAQNQALQTIIEALKTEVGTLHDQAAITEARLADLEAALTQMGSAGQTKASGTRR